MYYEIHRLKREGFNLPKQAGTQSWIAEYLLQNVKNNKLIFFKDMGKQVNESYCSIDNEEVQEN